LRHAPYSGSMTSMSGTELKLTRLAMEVQAVELAERMGKSRSSLSHIESRGRVKEATAKAYLEALATFGTVPTVTIERAA
jgi:transcriptional regulator with XRE-family HTH domain